uniref:(California timema) hypothetical protein n=1 Tax=Timema californicum TaxID=61474 RepID=A0A7R9IYG8_TIMCA|nr:unnamed protein product [Timema californicum]
MIAVALVVALLLGGEDVTAKPSTTVELPLGGGTGVSFGAGGVSASFGGYRASAGLGGLAGGGGAAGGLHAEAGTPGGPSARAGLGGAAGSGAVGGLYSQAEVGGGGPAAAAGLGGVAGENVRLMCGTCELLSADLSSRLSGAPQRLRVQRFNFNMGEGGVLYSGYNKGGGGYTAGAGLGSAGGPPQYVSSSSSSSASSSASSSVNGGGGAIIQIPQHHQKHKHVNRKGPEFFNDVFNVSTGDCTLSGQLTCWATGLSYICKTQLESRLRSGIFHDSGGPTTVESLEASIVICIVRVVGLVSATVSESRSGFSPDRASNLHGAAVKTVVKYRDNTGVKSRIRGEVYTAGGGSAAGGGAVGGGGLVGGSGASSSSSSWSSSASAGAGIGGFTSQGTATQNGPGFYDNVFNIPISVLKAVSQLLSNKHRRRRR